MLAKSLPVSMRWRVATGRYVVQLTQVYCAIANYLSGARYINVYRHGYGCCRSFRSGLILSRINFRGLSLCWFYFMCMCKILPLECVHLFDVVLLRSAERDACKCRCVSTRSTRPCMFTDEARFGSSRSMLVIILAVVALVWYCVLWTLSILGCQTA